MQQVPPEIQRWRDSTPQRVISILEVRVEVCFITDKSHTFVTERKCDKLHNCRPLLFIGICLVQSISQSLKS